MKTIKQLEKEIKKLQPEGIAYYGREVDEKIIKLKAKLQALKDILKEVETWEWLDYEGNLREKIKQKIQGA